MRVRREEGSKLSRLRPGSGLAWYAGLASITIRIRLSYDMNTLFNFFKGGSYGVVGYKYVHFFSSLLRHRNLRICAIPMNLAGTLTSHRDRMHPCSGTSCTT